MVNRVLTAFAVVLSVLAITACAPPQVAVHNGGISVIDNNVNQPYHVLGYVSDKFCLNDVVSGDDKSIKITGYREALLAKAKKIHSNAEDVIRLAVQQVDVYDIDNGNSWGRRASIGCRSMYVVEATVVQYK